MDKKQYNNVIDYTLKHDKSAQTDDSLATARAIFTNMGVALPQGDIKEVFETIKSGNYMSWRSCTMKEAQAAADQGIAAIGISDKRILVLSANDEEQPITKTTSVMPISGDTSALEVDGLKYFSYGRGNTSNPTTIYCSNSYLTLTQMTSNAQYILDYLRARGWTKKAVCGMLGNMQTESTINPGIWQNLQANNYNVGFGLVQWTPASKLINWANQHCLNYLSIDCQLNRILYEVENGIQWYQTSSYPISFSAFTQSTQSVNYLAAAFLYNYERPASYSTLSTRQTQANYWYNNLT